MAKIEDAIQQREFKDQHNKAVVNLLYTHSYLVASQSELFKAYGISPEQYNVLRILRGQNGAATSVSSIQDRMLNKMSNASRLVEKLKQKDLVRRDECPADRRQVDVLITAAGLELLKKLEKEIVAANIRVIHLTEEEAIQLNHLLDKLRG
jgi:DNA-binding MarR family transcriptional regulator